MITFRDKHASGETQTMGATHDKTGLLLINLGTPDSTRVADVRAYLREFLSDPRVLDMPAIKRALIVNLFILPRRPRRSAAAYAKIWTEDGSPLLIHGRELAAKVQARFERSGVMVELAMRYGNPSIDAALDRFRQHGVDHVVALPLFPQYSSAATGSSVEALLRAAGRRWNTPWVQIVPPFYDHPAFIDAVAEVAQPVLERAEAERVLFSYHGLPERHCRKSDDAGGHCLARADCCQTIGQANRNCYRAQCLATTRLLGDRLRIPQQQRVDCFQSRLGRDPWIGPHTDAVLADLARQGFKRIAVLTPAFVADCLETLEEIGMRAASTWRELGGEALQLVPCVNASDRWADALVAIVRDHAAWLRSQKEA